MRLALFTCYLSLLTSCLLAQVPFAWDADASVAASVRKDVYRGETVPLRPSWTGVSTNGWTFSLLWQTNGMGSAWWSDTADAFTWKPARDFGAERYTLFIRAASPDGVSYRANAVIRMLPSPGFIPAEAPSPTFYPDLAEALAPYVAALVSADLSKATNYTDSVADGLRLRIDALAADGGLAGSAGAAAQSLTSLRVMSADSNWWVGVAAGGTATLYRAASSNLVALPPECSAIWPPSGGTNAFPFSSGVWTGFVAAASLAGQYAAGDNVVKYIGTPSVFDDLYWSAAPGPAAETALPGGSGNAHGTSVLYRVSYGIPCGSFVRHQDLAAALSNALAQAGDSAAATNALAAASNAWLRAGSALDASAAAAAGLTSATNFIIRTYFAASNAWIEVDYSNKLARVVTVSAGTTNAVTLSETGAALDPSATNSIWLAISANHAALTSALGGKADKAWGRYAPDGSANPDPDYMVWMNKAATVYASGYSWSTYGTYAVITSAGTVAYETGTNGTWRIGPDATNHFGYVLGGSVIVGAIPESLAVHYGGTEGGYAEISFAYTGGDWPVIWFTPSLAIDFEVLPSPAWVDNMDGTATAVVPATTAKGFWKATTSASITAVFEATMPARFTGGVFGGVGSPVIYDSTITISSGGHTYRIPAQLAD